DLYPYFISIGGDSGSWSKLLRIPLSGDQAEQMQSWQMGDWKEFIETRWKADIDASLRGPDGVPIDLDAELLHSVKSLLPPQPWPKGIHREIGDKLNLTDKQMSRYIRELIRRGDFMEQLDGQLFPFGTPPPEIRVEPASKVAE
ncbi:MAG: hypothetical protein ACKVQK_10830, partial [Burkholderiales bacterium]